MITKRDQMALALASAAAAIRWVGIGGVYPVKIMPEEWFAEHAEAIAAAQGIASVHKERADQTKAAQQVARMRLNCK